MSESEKLLKEYQSLLSSEKIEDLFKLLDIITMLQDDDKLSLFIDKNQQILLKNNPILLIGKHVHYFLVSDRILEGLDVLSYYQNAPFISVEVEDFMKELKEEILKTIKPKNRKPYTNEEAFKDLYSNNPQCIAKAINYLSEINIRPLLLSIKEVLISKLDYRYKILIQFILIEQKIDDNIKITDNQNGEFIINPSKMNLPFDDQEYIECSKYLNSLNESPSVIKMAIEILNNLQIKIFPKSFIKEVNSPLILGEIVVYMAKQYLEENDDISNLILNTNMKEEEIENLIKKINEIIV